MIEVMMNQQNYVPIFSDNLRKYNSQNVWVENGIDAKYISINKKYLSIYKDNNNDSANYINLRIPLNKIYNFKFEADFRIKKEDVSENDFKLIELIENSTVRAYVERKLIGGDRYQVRDENDIIIGNFTADTDTWLRVKIIQSFIHQISTSGKLSAFMKKSSEPDTEWKFLGQTETQSGGITDIRLGHIESNIYEFHFDYKDLILRGLEIEN